MESKDLVQLFPGIFQIEGKLATLNIYPGHAVYGERLIEIDGKEYRMWDPFRSKLAGAIKKGLKATAIKKGDAVLYLGAASGTTSSHVADIVGKKGIVYCVEFAERPMRDLINICEVRDNMVPILADSRKPADYRKYVEGKVDVIYQDVAQKDQVRILDINADMYLKEGGEALLCVKSQSIDVTKTSRSVYHDVLKELKDAEFAVLQQFELSPYDLNHLFVHLKR
ncbi:Fibrillarin-like rRNA/tRNA 2'-O-methyltransferase [uncultured archaeon]|nr:Fibrillarin-like rRNA/tRNA 2'-O-methyltransferase [uncultured archaeon]